MRGDAEDIKLASVPEHPPNDTDELDLGDSTSEAVESGFTMDSRRLAVYGLVVLVIIAALYFVLPKITETGSALEKIQDADPVWIAVALGVNLLSFAAYIALFAGTVGGRTAPPKVRERLDWRASYQITLAGSRPRAFSRPAARAESRSPIGRCGAPACRPASPPAGWSRSWCFSTRSTSAPWWCAGSCCGSGFSQAPARSA